MKTISHSYLCMFSNVSALSEITEQTLISFLAHVFMLSTTITNCIIQMVYWEIRFTEWGKSCLAHPVVRMFTHTGWIVSHAKQACAKCHTRREHVKVTIVATASDTVKRQQ